MADGYDASYAGRPDGAFCRFQGRYWLYNKQLDRWEAWWQYDPATTELRIKSKNTRGHSRAYDQLWYRWLWIERQNTLTREELTFQ